MYIRLKMGENLHLATHTHTHTLSLFIPPPPKISPSSLQVLPAKGDSQQLLSLLHSSIHSLTLSLSLSHSFTYSSPPSFLIAKKLF